MTIIEIPHSTVVSYNNIAISWIKWRCKCYVEMWPTLCLWNNLLMWRFLVFCKYRCAFSSKLNSIDDNCLHFPIEIQIIFHREPDNKTKIIPLYWHRPSLIICQLKQIALQKAEFSWIYYNLSISQRIIAIYQFQTNRCTLMTKIGIQINVCAEIDFLPKITFTVQV